MKKLSITEQNNRTLIYNAVVAASRTKNGRIHMAALAAMFPGLGLHKHDVRPGKTTGATTERKIRDIVEKMNADPEDDRMIASDTNGYFIARDRKSLFEFANRFKATTLVRVQTSLKRAEVQMTKAERIAVSIEDGHDALPPLWEGRYIVSVGTSAESLMALPDVEQQVADRVAAKLTETNLQPL